VCFLSSGAIAVTMPPLMQLLLGTPFMPFVELSLVTRLLVPFVELSLVTRLLVTILFVALSILSLMAIPPRTSIRTQRRAKTSPVGVLP